MIVLPIVLGILGILLIIAIVRTRRGERETTDDEYTGIDAETKERERSEISLPDRFPEQTYTTQNQFAQPGGNYPQQQPIDTSHPYSFFSDKLKA